MSFGSPAMEKSGRQAVPQSCGSATVADSCRTGAALFSLAMILQIPVGYQDDAGFHCGEPKGDMSPMMLEQEDVFSDSHLI
jgi:hypothetical protein